MPRTEPRLSPGHEAGAAEGLKCSNPRVPAAARCSQCLCTTAPGRARPQAVPGVETRTTANGAEKIRADELHLHRHPSGRRTTLPGTHFAGEMGQIYFLQKICFLISACPPKPRVLPAGPGAAPEAPAHPARCRGWEPRALHRCNAHPKPSPGGGNQLAPGPPGRGPHQGCRARSCRGRKTLCVPH